MRILGGRLRIIIMATYLYTIYYVNQRVNIPVWLLGIIGIGGGYYLYNKIADIEARLAPSPPLYGPELPPKISDAFDPSKYRTMLYTEQNRVKCVNECREKIIKGWVDKYGKEHKKYHSSNFGRPGTYCSTVCTGAFGNRLE